MAKVREQINKIFEQEMDRKKFLEYSAGIFLTVFGVTGLINAILTSGAKSKLIAQVPAQEPKKKGYGSARFGN